MFLNPSEVAELTGIRTGRDRQTREQRQAAELTRLRIPHYVNAVGRPIVARAVIEGRATEPPQAMSWEPGLRAA